MVKKDSLKNRKWKPNLNELLLTYSNNSPVKYNKCYIPIIFPSETNLLRIKSDLEGQLMGTRRNFYPGLNNLDFTGESCPYSDDISTRVLRLPLYHCLAQEEQERIVGVLVKNIVHLIF